MQQLEYLAKRDCIAFCQIMKKGHNYWKYFGLFLFCWRSFRYIKGVFCLTCNLQQVKAEAREEEREAIIESSLHRETNLKPLFVLKRGEVRGSATLFPDDLYPDLLLKLLL